ncbi:MAG: trigger factor [Gemmatimonadota bacterium]
MSTTELKVAVEEPGSWARRLTITVPAERVSRERKAVARSITASVRMPGFRKGHVPANVVERHYGATIRERVVERMMEKAYREALAEHGLEPISEAAVGNVRYDEGADLTFDVQFDVRPEIEIARSGGFSVRRPSVGVGEEEVERVLQRLRDEQATWEPIEEGSGADGDVTFVRITPLDDEGVEGETRGYEVILGRQQALPDVEEAIRSLEIGGSGEFLIAAGADPGDAAGTADVQAKEERRIRLELVAARRPDVPEADDAFAQAVGDFDSIEDLRARVREDLVVEADREADRAVHQQLIERIIEANAFDVPNTMIDRYVAGLVPASDDADPEQLEQIRQAARPAAERAIKRMLILERLADSEGLRASEVEVDARLSEIAERNNRTSAQVRRELKKAGRLDAIGDALTEEKVFGWLAARSEVEIEPAGE